MEVPSAQYTTLKPAVLSGFKATKLADDTECVIVSWEMLPHWLKELKRWVGDGEFAIVWDELHKGKAWNRKEKYVTPNGRVGYRWKDKPSRGLS